MVNPPVIRARNLTQLITQFSKRSQALPCPVIPLHPTLPQEVPFDLSIACDSRHCLTPYAAHLRAINEATRFFMCFKKIESFFKDFFFLFELRISDKEMERIFKFVETACRSLKFLMLQSSFLT